MAPLAPLALAPSTPRSYAAPDQNLTALSTLTDEHKKILAERLAEHRKNPQEGQSWEEVKVQLWNDR